jgi:hypothetical protein
MENNKEATSVADAFNADNEELKDEKVVKAEEAAQAEEASVVDETQSGEIEKTETKSEPETGAESETKVAETKEPTWTELNLPQYEGMSKAEVAERISFINREFGRATNTVGELRKQLNGVITNNMKPAEAIETKKSVLDAMPKLSESDAIRFNEIYAESPVKAIMMFGGESIIKQMVSDEISAKVPKDIDSIVNKKTEEIKYESFLTKHNLTEESPEVQWIKQVREDYLTGQNRSDEELFGLAQMWKAKDENAEFVYSLMKKHPTMSFEEAKSFLPKKTAQAVNKTKVENDLNKLNNANHTSQTKKVSDDTMTVYESVAEAFGSVD